MAKTENIDFKNRADRMRGVPGDALPIPEWRYEARPTAVPDWLRQLPPESEVRCIVDGGGSSMTTAEALIADIEEVVTRQALGYFRVSEAAQLLAEANDFERGPRKSRAAWIEQIYEAAERNLNAKKSPNTQRSGEAGLPLFDEDKLPKLRLDSPRQAHHDLLKVQDLAAFVEQLGGGHVCFEREAQATTPNAAAGDVSIAFENLPPYIREQWETASREADGRRWWTHLGSNGNPTSKLLAFDEFLALATEQKQQNERGLFRACEVAHLVSRHKGMDANAAKQFMRGLRAAAGAGDLPFLRCDSGFEYPPEVNENLHSGHYFRRVDLDAWLSKIGCGYALPVPENLEKDTLRSARPAAKPEAISMAGPVLPMKKRGLVQAYMRLWPTIESDLSDAARNGLSVAKIGSRGWDESKALEWARSKGKLQIESIPPTPEPADPMAAHYLQLGNLPRRKHRG